MYPYAVRLSAEKVETENNVYSVYYDSRDEIANADIIVLGIDPSLAESHDLAGHFMRYAKQYNNFSTVAMNLTDDQLEAASLLVEEQEEEMYAGFLGKLKNVGGVSEDLCDFISELSFINRTVPGYKKIHIVSLGEDEHSAKSCADCIYKKRLESERSVVCIVDTKYFSEDCGFSETLSSLAGTMNVVYVNCEYTKSCASPDTHRIVSFPFERKEGGVYFVSQDKMRGFLDYYKKMLGDAEYSSKDCPQNQHTEFYFVVSGGQKVK